MTLTLIPKLPRDLALAPVAAEIDSKLQRLRSLPVDRVEHELQLELDRPAFRDTRDERADRVAQYAIRNVGLRGWNVTVTEDGSALHLAGGSVSLDLALGATVQTFIEAPAVVEQLIAA